MKLGFVAPFYGARAAGGAEAECRHTAVRLARAGHDVHVFTTCLLDTHHDWNVNVHRAGTSVEDGVSVHRHRVAYTDLGAFYRLNARLAAGESLSAREEQQFVAFNLNSADLLRVLDEARDTFDAFCLIPYLFGTTVFGAQVTGPKAVLIPCLHDEPYARLGPIRDLFRAVRRIVFHSAAEQALASELYGLPADRGILLGEGVETGFESNAARFRARFGLDGPFVLCAGKKDRAKNVHTLIDCFTRYRRRRPDSGLRLVLIGPGSLPVPDDMRNAIVDLGYVSDQEKKDAYSAASIFCQPSLNESFSIVLMEAWNCATPAVVHARCAVTREHAMRSGGGFFFENCAEFEGCLDRLLGDRELARHMGAAGRRYVLQNFEWNRIVARYEREVFAALS